MTNQNVDEDYQTRRRNILNLLIFEELLGAARQKLAGNQCGLTYDGKDFPCFAGHARFEMQECWEDEYAGPDFCNDLAWVYAAEATAVQRGMIGQYIQALVRMVCPQWHTLKTSKEVVSFWYALAHAMPLYKAGALAAAIEKSTRLENIVERAVELSLPISTAGGQARVAAVQPFVAFVRSLKPQQAEELLAVMYLGRGDHSSFAAALKAVAGFSFDLNALAQQMAGKAPLTRYLRDGLAKWLAEQQP